MRPLPLAIGLISIFACHGAWYLSTNSQLIEYCNPYLNGCFSISRAARSEASLHFFRFFMGVTSAFALLFWFQASKMIYQGDRLLRIPIQFYGKVLALLSCILLNLYISYLGTDGDLYSWLRRTGVKGFYISTYLSILIVMIVLSNKKGFAQIRSTHTDIARTFTICKAMALAPIVFGFLQVTSTIYFQHESQPIWFSNLNSTQIIDRVENIVEWWVTLFISLWFVFFSRLQVFLTFPHPSEKV